MMKQQQRAPAKGLFLDGRARVLDPLVRALEHGLPLDRQPSTHREQPRLAAEPRPGRDECARPGPPIAPVCQAFGRVESESAQFIYGVTVTILGRPARVRRPTIPCSSARAAARAEPLASSGDARNLQRSAAGYRSNSSVAVISCRKNKLSPFGMSGRTMLNTARRLRFGTLALESSLDVHQNRGPAETGAKRVGRVDFCRGVEAGYGTDLFADCGGRLLHFRHGLRRPGLVSRGRRSAGRCAE